VRGCQRSGDRDGIPENVGYRQAIRWNQLLECLAVDELHHDEVSPIVLVDLVDGDDVRMIQRRRSFGFVNEPLLARLVCQLLGTQDFDANETIEPQIAGLIDNTHSAFAELGDDLVMG